jgi:hypothetical protein
MIIAYLGGPIFPVPHLNDRGTNDPDGDLDNPPIGMMSTGEVVYRDNRRGLVMWNEDGTIVPAYDELGNPVPRYAGDTEGLRMQERFLSPQQLCRSAVNATEMGPWSPRPHRGPGSRISRRSRRPILLHPPSVSMSSVLADAKRRSMVADVGLDSDQASFMVNQSLQQDFVSPANVTMSACSSPRQNLLQIFDRATVKDRKILLYSADTSVSFFLDSGATTCVVGDVSILHDFVPRSTSLRGVGESTESVGHVSATRPCR